MKKHLLAVGVLLATALYGMAVSADDGEGAKPDYQVKSVPGKTYIIHREKIEALSDVDRLEWLHAGPLRKRMEKMGLDNGSPTEYHVTFRDGMQLDIAIEIDAIPEDQGDAQFKKTDEFLCVSYVHNGSAIDASDQWSGIFASLKDKGFESSGENREVAINRKGYDPRKHVTELQVGVVKK